MTIFESPFGDIALSERSITERVFDGLEGASDRVVLIDGMTGAEWTASRFMEAVKRLAGGLQARGWGEGKTVAIMAPNSPEYAVVFHGVCWAGGSAATVNPTYTVHEATHQLGDCGAEVVVTSPACIDVVREAAAAAGVEHIVVIGGEADGAVTLDDLYGEPQAAQTPVDLDRHPAALPYSSGTTGLPKGVILTHRNMSTNIDQTLKIFSLEPGESTVCFLPFFHIYGLNALLNPYLAAGGALVTMPRFDLEMFLDLTAKHGATRMFIAPPVALALAKHPAVENFDLSGVTSIFCAAAPLGNELATACEKRLNVAMLQGYGMTELSPVSHLLSLETNRLGSVGLTAPGTKCRIVDPETGADQGVGEEGELWIKGPQVMLGYLNNPQATAETIDPDGWLKTGDLACFDADGHLEIRDRLKELIKYKGFQVAPAELEALLIGHSEIADVAVVGAPDEEAGELPTAFVTLAAGSNLDAPAIMAYAADRLATFKQIRRVEFLDAIPKSASGKILRRELRKAL